MDDAGKTSELEDSAVEMIQSNPIIQEEKWGRGGEGEGGGERRKRSILECTRCGTVSKKLMRELLKSQEENGLKIFEEIMAESFPNLMKCLNLLI